MNKVGVFVFSILAFVGSTTSARSELSDWRNGQNANSHYMRSYGQALPPIGHVGFCRRNPAECNARSSDTERFELTAQRRQDLNDVNAIVNEMVKPESDLELYGRLEHWTYPSAKGDCEDYVLLKRRMLMERGWPSSALLITVVRDERNEGHAVLTARTDSGDFILDNKKQDVMVWNASGYTFIKRQSFDNPVSWVSLMPPGLPQQATLSGTKAR